MYVDDITANSYLFIKVVQYLSSFQTSLPHIESGYHTVTVIVYCGEGLFQNGIFFLT